MPSSQTASQGKRRKRAVKKGRIGPKSRDRHWLYQEAVQSPEAHAEFFDQIFEFKHGRPASSLKEDFCGTALLCAHWADLRPDNTAIGVDLDLPTLDWGREHNLDPLSSDARKRVTLLHKNVLEVSSPPVDIVAALNFSYFEFKTRDALRDYFHHARESLKKGGVLILDMFGGWESQMEEIDRTRMAGFTYVWEQTSFDPISHLTQFHIHFKFHGGGGIQKAFEYNWRLWMMPEISELLAEAGFNNVEVWWETIDEDTDEGSGEYELLTESENFPGWITFVVASVD